MTIIKAFVLLTIFISSSAVGYMVANRYSNRLNELIEMKNILIVLKTKMRYTYETLPDIFTEIANNTKDRISAIFENTVQNLQNNEMNIGQAWRKSIMNTNSNLNVEDKEILASMDKLLGKTDLEGQIGEIDLTTELLDVQIEKAESEKQKNVKLYKTLGNVVGITIVILLI